MIFIIDDERYSLSVKHMMDNLISDSGKNASLLSPSFIGEDERYITIKRNGNSIVSILQNSDTIFNKIEIKTEENIRNSYKKAVFILLKELAEEDRTKWGILTGIRPIKLYHMLLENNEEKEAYQILKEKYLISDEKIDLIKKIYNNQKEIIDKISGTLGIYVNIPFCPSRCNYCSFFSEDINNSREKIETYLYSIENEIKRVSRSKIVRENIITTIYVGGGTPGVLSKDKIDFLIKSLKENFYLENLREFTFELGRPDTITYEKLQILKDNNIDRISINPQTMKDETLEKIGRHHRVSDFIEKYNMAREIGIENINMDFILGLEEETKEDMIMNIKKALKLNPDSITIHSLALKTKSDLYSSEIKINQEDITKAYNEIVNILEKNKYHPYYLYRQKRAKGNLENIGFAKKDKFSAYNIGMMDEYQSIIGIGAGASSKILTDGKISERIPNYKDIDLYIKKEEGEKNDRTI